MSTRTTSRRFERVLARLRELDPGVTITEVQRHPTRDVGEAMNAAPPGARKTMVDPAVLDPAEHPELVAALVEMVRKHEQSWLDEAIPAVAGHTPRECGCRLHPPRDDLMNVPDSFAHDEGKPGDEPSTPACRAGFGHLACTRHKGVAQAVGIGPQRYVGGMKTPYPKWLSCPRRSGPRTG
jgi:hypothetical protein